MVRNIVGTLVAVGRGRLHPGAIEDILAARDRRRAGENAPARGLFLEHVSY
ncbi:tRNA pseudouridine synthase A [Candidatus Magnetobacterium bavaricum]|uniref:tRNA pseudouridine synthase A n=1 Tax=Candidatus Magnetobacterium bavaricum TaxID=29290 RepID=A0A0F3GPG4_9BACT|nr:tRNA pseudouridine synthase A [Candidatus Magnetobacterium bavaricum]